MTILDGKEVFTTSHIFKKLGKLCLCFSDVALFKVSWDEEGVFLNTKNRKQHSFSKKIIEELESYESCRLTELSIPLDLYFCKTAFQRSVLEKTLLIPYGNFSSYSELAKRVMKPGASRAVGTALNKNPLPIFIPCHRVLPKTQKIGGFRYSAERKKRLLDLENIKYL